MKTYKIKSLIYFSLFAASAYFYYNIEQQDKFENQTVQDNFFDIDTEELEDSESNKDNFPLQ